MSFFARLAYWLERSHGAIEAKQEHAPAQPAPLTIADIEQAVDDLRQAGIWPSLDTAAGKRRALATHLRRTECEVYDCIVMDALDYEMERTPAYKLATARREAGRHAS